eukprot:CAMPEP_0184479844 /NCGR_PEP_ID=MMETSP0113_2-20130426/1404_1 /TAXON_ID=91329 /ORGANISM="Norrisiella sphaerica, Strain BC52" /LENGTH=733 /DNA_ID=CAMNT_0026858005 /DNA_START=167 /DNA_END=2368 /DNA_ORIENTATION=+
MANYKLGPIIGLGTYGEVRYAENENGLPVAIKIVDLSKFEEDAAEMMTKEIKILQSLDHPQVISVLEVLYNVPHKGSWCESCACSELKSTFNGTCANCNHDTCDHVEGMESRDVLMIVQELAAGGELFGLLTQGPFPEALARFYFRQLIDGLEHCHSRGVFHRDLKPENLVLDACFNLKIVDFGLAALNGKGEGGTHHSGVGSQPYTAPEVYYNKELYNNHGYRGEPADLWSCAVILYVMLKGSPPFRRPLLKSIGNSPRLRRCPHFSALMRGKGYNKISPAAKEFLQKLFIIDPNKRLTIKEIRNEPWFKGPVPSPLQVKNMVKHKAREVWMEQLKPEMAEVLEKFSGSMDDEKDDKLEREGVLDRHPMGSMNASAPVQIPRRPRPNFSPTNSYISTPTKSLLYNSFGGASPGESPPFMPSASPAFSPMGTPSQPSTPSHLPSPSPIHPQIPAIFNLASGATLENSVQSISGVRMPYTQSRAAMTTPPQMSALGRSLLRAGNPLSSSSSSKQAANGSIPGTNNNGDIKERDRHPKEDNLNDSTSRITTSMSTLQLHNGGFDIDKDCIKHGTSPEKHESSPEKHESSPEKTSTNLSGTEGADSKENLEAATSRSRYARMSEAGNEPSGGFAVHTKLRTVGSAREVVCILTAYFATSASMHEMECAFEGGANGPHSIVSTLHVTGCYKGYPLTCKIDIINEARERRSISFRRIQGNTLAFQRFFEETSQAIWNR